MLPRRSKKTGILRGGSHRFSYLLSLLLYCNKHDYSINLKKDNLTKQIPKLNQREKIELTDNVVTDRSDSDNFMLSVVKGRNTIIKDINDYIKAAENGNSDAQYYLCVL